MKLTAKQYANGLVGKYFSTCHKSSDFELSWKLCKQCALIHVDGLIKYAKTFGDVTLQDVDFFNDIKEEIGLL